MYGFGITQPHKVLMFIVAVHGEIEAGDGDAAFDRRSEQGRVEEAQ